MPLGLRSYIKRRNTEEWQEFFLDRWTGLRIFAQENGEKASFLGFGIGIAIVLFFKLFIFLFCMAALAYLLIMLLSESKKTQE